MVGSVTHVVHVISQLSPGGASRAALAVAKYSARAGPFRHTLISLEPAGPLAGALAQAAGVEFLNAPSPLVVQTVIAGADLVHLHFWNTPELYRRLRADWPSVRLLIWLHVAGDTAPQVVTPNVVAFGDRIVASSAYTMELPVLQGPAAAQPVLVTAGTDFERLAGIEPAAHSGFNVGYIGTVDFDKMHPDFVALHAAIDTPQTRFIVCGPGGAYPLLRRQATAAGAAERFDFRGYVADLQVVLSSLDVFGYPLCRDSYASAELVLREAMLAGVPPVVFQYGSTARIVTHGVTGLVVEDAAGYRAAIEQLYHQPAERRRLGANARTEAIQSFGADVAAAGFNSLYAEMLRKPKRPRAWGSPPRTGAEQWIEALGELAADFQVSRLAADMEACLAAEARIAAASPLLSSATAGGILHYRRAFPDDPHLRLWAGLVLHAQGRPALAVSEFNQAARLGLAHWRVGWYQALAAEACGAFERAAGEVAGVLVAAPDFKPAQDMEHRLQQRPAARQRLGPA